MPLPLIPVLLGGVGALVAKKCIAPNPDLMPIANALSGIIANNMRENKIKEEVNAKDQELKVLFDDLQKERELVYKQVENLQARLNKITRNFCIMKEIAGDGFVSNSIIWEDILKFNTNAEKTLESFEKKLQLPISPMVGMTKAYSNLLSSLYECFKSMSEEKNFLRKLRDILEEKQIGLLVFDEKINKNLLLVAGHIKMCGNLLGVPNKNVIKEIEECAENICMLFIDCPFLGVESNAIKELRQYQKNTRDALASI